MHHLLHLVGAPMDWTNERVEELRRLWGQGQTASRIADLLGGITRNAVIGKAHRLGLRGRPSPIRRDENGTVSRPATAPRVSVPLPATAKAELPPADVARTAAMPAAAPSQPKMAQGGARSCSWPMGDPKQAGFHFCGGEAVPGRPYCATHCGMAYQRKAEAAA
jgi:GcrA cell cycle regulator